jgi:hypothetical protein
MKALAAIFVLVSGAAMACEPAKMSGPYGQRLSLGNCSFEIRHDEWSAAFLSEVKDLGHGFVLQNLADGTACEGNEVDRLVQDCSSGRVAVFGENEVAFWMPSTDEDGNMVRSQSELLLERVESNASAGTPMSVDEILSEARTRQIEFVLETKTNKPIAINGHVFPIGSGCQTVYPDS